MPRTFSYSTTITWRDGTENTLSHPFLEEGSVIACVGLSQGKEPVRMVTYRLRQAPNVEGWVNAFAYESNLRFEVSFNAAAWLATATEDAIVELARNYWCGCEMADSVTRHIRDYDLDVARFLMLAEDVARSTIYSEINEATAMTWLKSYRPEIASTLKELSDV